MPLAYLMGVDWKDAGMVGELIGMKTFLKTTCFIWAETLSISSLHGKMVSHE
jgi:nucleoside permease NupC